MFFRHKLGYSVLIRIPQFFLWIVLIHGICETTPVVWAARYDGKLTVVVLDDKTRQPLAARLELLDSRGRPVRIRAKNAVPHGEYLVFDGQVTLELRKGTYQFLIEAGPEYQTRPGHFVIERHAEDTTEVILRRHVDMKSEGWWAGDLDVHQKSKVLPLMMRAGGTTIAPYFNRENIQGKCKQEKLSSESSVGPLLSLDYRRGGGLLLLGIGSSDQSYDVCALDKEDSTVKLLNQAHEAGDCAVALMPFAWDLPLWVATGKLDAVQIIHRHALGNNVVDHEGWGKPRDKTFFPGKTGNGRWSEAIYHHLLNCGLRIPPAAGSGSGENGNAVGTNRVYVHCEEFSVQNWMAGLRNGQVMVTCGPLLRTRVDGNPPGCVFQLDSGRSRDFQISLRLSFYEKTPVEYLEIVKNGRVAHEVRLSELVDRQGRLPSLHFDNSGWFLVRAMTNETKNYQFASTGPYYVQKGQEPRISRKSVQFFLTWLDEAANKFADNLEVHKEIMSARPYWQDLLSKANVD